MIERGQFFTKNEELKNKVFELCKNKGRILEPSAGAGHISKYFEDNGREVDVSIEIDKNINFIYDKIIIKDFFEYSVNEKFNTVVGNPPYVRQQSIESGLSIDTKYSSLNLYLYFIEKCFYHLEDRGEIIFIIPREFFTNSRASGIREMLYNNGTITDVVDYQDRKMFDDADPYVVIIRYEKGNFSHITNYTIEGKTEVKKEFINSGFIKFSNHKGVPLSDFFDIKVGIVSGANKIYENEELGNIEIICSDFIKTGKKRKFIFFEEEYPDRVLKYLGNFKDKLISRKIKNFDDKNWFEWGAIRNINLMKQDGFYIYVNAKTREEAPFFREKASYFDGSILALVPKQELDLDKWVEELNSSRELFLEQGFLVGNKLQFTQNSLSNFLISSPNFT